MPNPNRDVRIPVGRAEADDEIVFGNFDREEIPFGDFAPSAPVLEEPPTKPDLGEQASIIEKMASDKQRFVDVMEAVEVRATPLSFGHDQLNPVRWLEAVVIIGAIVAVALVGLATGGVGLGLALLSAGLLIGGPGLVAAALQWAKVRWRTANGEISIPRYEAVEFEIKKSLEAHGVDPELGAYMFLACAFTDRSVHAPRDMTMKAKAWCSDKRKTWSMEKTAAQISRVVGLCMCETPVERFTFSMWNDVDRSWWSVLGVRIRRMFGSRDPLKSIGDMDTFTRSGTLPRGGALSQK